MILSMARLQVMKSPDAWKAYLIKHWDRMHGLDFQSIITPEQVGLDPSRAFRSSPSGNRHLAKVIRALGIQANDKILDIGCGKGSAMRTMLQFSFACVDGIELAPAIAAIARNNFKRLGLTKATIYTGDAASFDSYSRYNIYYLYNPFPDGVMNATLARLAPTQRQDEIIFIYNNPTCHELLQARGLKDSYTFKNQWGGDIKIYTNKPIEQSRLHHLKEH